MRERRTSGLRGYLFAAPLLAVLGMTILFPASTARRELRPLGRSAGIAPEIILSILRGDVAAVMRNMDENLAKMIKRILEMLTDRWHGEEGEDLLHARQASYSQTELGRS